MKFGNTVPQAGECRKSIAHVSPYRPNFPVGGEAANLLRTCYGKTGVMDFGLKYASTDAVGFSI